MRWLLPLLLLLAACGEEVYLVPEHASEAEVHWVRTEDAAWIHLQRYKSDGQPVVLVHGISSNHHFWNLEPHRSLALYLSERGYDVWNLDLRGHGPARHDPLGKRQKVGWTVDDYGWYDLPAAFDFVEAQTGRSDVAYVGHSMGGMVLAVYLAREADPPLSTAIAVGSPLDFRDPDPVTKTALGLVPLARVLPFVPTPMAGNVAAVTDKGTPLHLDDLLYNPDNIETESRKLMLRRVASPMSRGELGQFQKILDEGEFVSADGDIEYRKVLGEVALPMLFIAGRADRIAPPDRVRSFFDAVGSDDKRLIIASEANGFHADYGHLDLGVGDHVENDIFPLVSDWLGEHTTK